MRRALLLAVALSSASCLKVWDVGGPFACADDGNCQGGLTCDDGVCCQPGGSPACPTLAVEGACPGGASPVTYFRDTDGDGFGDATKGRGFCGQPRKEAWVLDATDCDDRDGTVNPRATERCNGVDDNCNGELDEGTPRTAFYRDDDGDGFGEDCATCAVAACARPKGYAARGGDCSPRDATVFPGAPERCNNVDDNCNGQRDDPPFLDVESPGFDGGTFACLTGQPGACSAGGLQCVFSAASNRFETVCVPRVAPSTDVCGDGVDQDCDGAADDAPGCGGPLSLTRVTGGRSAALALTLADTIADSKLPARCLRREASAAPMAWLSPSWIGNDALKHVWFVEAPAGTFWDLSKSGATLHLDFAHTEVGGTGAVQPNPPWGDGSWFKSPVITLCGEKEADYRRWVPPASGIMSAASPFVVDVPLSAAPAQWTVEGQGSGFDLSRVRALELTVSPVQASASSPVTFRISFSADAGFR